MSEERKFPIDEDGLSAVAAKCYPDGKAWAFSRGHPDWAAAAEEALSASLIFVPLFVHRLFVREMEDRQVPLAVILEYERNATVRDEVYVRYPPGKERKTKYKFVRFVTLPEGWKPGDPLPES